jgi:hypothetical protein
MGWIVPRRLSLATWIWNFSDVQIVFPQLCGSTS